MMTLAKGLTGAALPLGAVVLSADMAGRVENRMLNAGLTYCGHPMSCAAGLAALSAYEDEKLIERSRVLASPCSRAWSHCNRDMPSSATCAAAMACSRAGTGGRSRDAAMHLPWPATPPQLKALVAEAMAQGVSFATRGNLILLAPPLVIGEEELTDAIVLLDRLLTKFFP